MEISTNPGDDDFVFIGEVENEFQDTEDLVRILHASFAKQDVIDNILPTVEQIDVLKHVCQQERNPYFENCKLPTTLQLNKIMSWVPVERKGKNKYYQLISKLRKKYMPPIAEEEKKKMGETGNNTKVITKEEVERQKSFVTNKLLETQLLQAVDLNSIGKEAWELFYRWICEVEVGTDENTKTLSQASLLALQNNHILQPVIVCVVDAVKAAKKTGFRTKAELVNKAKEELRKDNRLEDSVIARILDVNPYIDYKDEQWNPGDNSPPPADLNLLPESEHVNMKKSTDEKIVNGYTVNKKEEKVSEELNISSDDPEYVDIDTTLTDNLAKPINLFHLGSVHDTQQPPTSDSMAQTLLADLNPDDNQVEIEEEPEPEESVYPITTPGELIYPTNIRNDISNEVSFFNSTEEPLPVGRKTQRLQQTSMDYIAARVNLLGYFLRGMKDDDLANIVSALRNQNDIAKLQDAYRLLQKLKDHLLKNHALLEGNNVHYDQNSKYIVDWFNGNYKIVLEDIQYANADADNLNRRKKIIYAYNSDHVARELADHPKKGLIKPVQQYEIDFLEDKKLQGVAWDDIDMTECVSTVPSLVPQKSEEQRTEELVFGKLTAGSTPGAQESLKISKSKEENMAKKIAWKNVLGACCALAVLVVHFFVLQLHLVALSFLLLVGFFTPRVSVWFWKEQMGPDDRVVVKRLVAAVVMLVTALWAANTYYFHWFGSSEQPNGEQKPIDATESEKIATLNADLKALQKKYDLLLQSQDQSDLAEKVKSLEQQLVEKDQELTSKTSEISALGKDINKLHEQITRLNLELEQIHKRTDEQKSVYDASTLEKMSMQTQIDELKEQLAQKSQQTADSLWAEKILTVLQERWRKDFEDFKNPQSGALDVGKIRWDTDGRYNSDFIEDFLSRTLQDEALFKQLLNSDHIDLDSPLSQLALSFQKERKALGESLLAKIRDLVEKFCQKKTELVQSLNGKDSSQEYEVRKLLLASIEAGKKLERMFKNQLKTQCAAEYQRLQQALSDLQNVIKNLADILKQPEPTYFTLHQRAHCFVFRDGAFFIRPLDEKTKDKDLALFYWQAELGKPFSAFVKINTTVVQISDIAWRLPAQFATPLSFMGTQTVLTLNRDQNGNILSIQAGEQRHANGRIGILKVKDGEYRMSFDKDKIQHVMFGNLAQRANYYSTLMLEPACNYLKVASDGTMSVVPNR